MNEYKRLTSYMQVGDKIVAIQPQRKERIQAYIDRLFELEDKLENGLLIELPCRVGDTVYFIEYFCNYKGCSSNEQSFCCGCREMIERERMGEKYVISQKKFKLEDLNNVNKKFFITKEAAEARLKELQEKKNNG